MLSSLEESPCHKLSESLFLFSFRLTLCRDCLHSRRYPPQSCRVSSSLASQRLSKRGHIVKRGLSRLFFFSAGPRVPFRAIHNGQDCGRLWQAGSGFRLVSSDPLNRDWGVGVSPTPRENRGAATRIGGGRLNSHQTYFRVLGWS